MNRFNSLTKPLMWFMALLMVAFVTGCGGTTSSVDLPSVVSVSITPATPSIPISGIQQFTATATYSDGLTHDVTTAPGIAWSSASPLVATISNTAPTIGLATGVANGTSVITATIGGKSATKNLTVTTATLVSIAVTPAAPSIPITTTQQFTAIASYTAGPVINVTAAPGMVWGSSAAGVATISNTAPTIGLATGVANGSAGITATYGGKTGTANLTVNPAILQSIAVTPATASVPAGLNRQFTATGTYDYGPTVDVTTAASWTSGTAGATVGLHTGLAHGVTANVTPVVITASFGGKNATAALTVTAATVSSIAVTPATPSIAVSGTQPFTATATYSDGTTPNVTAASGVVWTSSDPTKATIVSNTGVATGVAAGTTDITAAFGGQTSLADTLTVTAAVPTAVLPGIAGSGGANLTNPTVNSASPSNSDTNVPTRTSLATGATYTVTPKQVVATFDEAMDPTTITPVGVFTLWNNTAGVDEPGTVTMNAASTIATFTPTAASLASNTSYTATISTAAKNAGSITAMPNAVAWSFTTRATNAATQTANVPFIGQEPVNLLTAGNYVIFANMAIANPGGAGLITGDMGIGTGYTSAAITGFSLALDATVDFSTSTLVVGKVYAPDYVGGTPSSTNATPALMTAAQNDMLTAYNEAAARSHPDATELFTGDMSGKTIYPGLYKWSTAVSINTDVTLDAQGDSNAVWIFQIAQDLGIASGVSVPAGIKVTLIGNAQAKNVFWQVGGLTGATLGTYSTFKGNIMSAKQIINQTGNVVDGKEMAQTQATLDASVITKK